ncbi:hypothetical protein PENSUB_11646 [Penicillium subrubescens]|uniref:Uncharacterized protein n=1 Tax=Penicillium subrubescens TaxID=1316194 RepID=A0A1Q5T2A7_9EURO|nr:hypothetical protein PENSUB_11646 [Penicillium subrubescens]
MSSKRKAPTRNLPAQNVAKKPREEEESDDEPAWRKIKVEDLDFDVSYVGKIESSKTPKVPKRKRWTHDGDEPLIKPEDLPKGWTSEERDLDPHDVDAQIARCKERIEDNIWPFIFKNRLKRLEKQKEVRDALIAKEPGLFQVIRRIAQLEDIAKSLEKDGDRHKVLPNVMAIRDAYRTRQLDIHEGLVTMTSSSLSVNISPNRAEGRDSGKKIYALKVDSTDIDMVYESKCFIFSRVLRAV